MSRPDGAPAETVRGPYPFLHDNERTGPQTTYHVLRELTRHALGPAPTPRAHSPG